jgi:hypothetical protein
MNELISEQARQYANENHPGSFVKYDPEWFALYNKKFAELIVRECIEQLVMEGDAWEQFSRNPPEGQENNASAALFAAYRLKEDAVGRLEEHFGVEE